MATGTLLSYPNGTQRKSMEPWLKDEIEFYPHQIAAIRTLGNKASFLLADDMGLGKTLEALAVFVVDVVRGYSEDCLIVCPVTLKENWAAEFEKFTNINYLVLEGSPVQRSVLLAQFYREPGPKALIVNYEQVLAHKDELNLVKGVDQWSRPIGWDVTIFDEAHYIKNPKAKRTKACLALLSKRNFMLTGTPLLNNVNELWALLNKIDKKRWPNYWVFANRYCVWGGFGGSQIVGVKNEAELRRILDEVMLRRLAKDVLELKDPVPMTRRVRMTKEQEELYERVIEDMKLLNLETGEDDEIENALTKFLRLKQICGSTYSFTGEDNSCKLDQAIPDLQEIVSNGYKAVVFTQFTDMIKLTRQRLAELRIPTWEISGAIKQEDRVPTVKAWSENPVPGVIVCGLQVAREGLNMTAGSYGLFLDKLFVPGLNEQAIRRLNRIGQDITRAVTIIDYQVVGSIEARVEAILKTKLKVSDSIVEGDNGWRKEAMAAIKEVFAA